MSNILVIGAGRSSNALIDYLLNHAERHNWQVTVADTDLAQAQQKVHHHVYGKAVALDVQNGQQRADLIQEADMVVSLLPAFMHIIVAKDCLLYGKHLATASYVSPEMKSLSEAVKAKGLIFINEIGLDPGIDHMSAMQIIDEIHQKGGTLQAFRSYTGGIVAPESDDNPWHYKFTWNPRNVILAGQGTAQYINQNKIKYIPYHRLFNTYEVIDVEEYGAFEVYANRDSLKYREVYKLPKIPTLLRGTIRHRGFCDAWDALVQLGLTDHTFKIEEIGEMTYAEWVASYLPNATPGNSLKAQVATLLGINLDSEVMQQLEWTGLFSDKKVPFSVASSAEILEHLLLEKWVLHPQDKDMVIMYHEFEYELKGKKHRKVASMVNIGNDSEDTSMARLVGLPLAIFVKMVMTGKVQRTGVLIPIEADIYTPVLEELASLGIVFHEKDEILPA